MLFRLTSAVVIGLACLWSQNLLLAGQGGSRPLPASPSLDSYVSAAKPSIEFQDCSSGCPVMIKVRAGNFVMGSPDGQPDDYLAFTAFPLHDVVIAKPFAVSKFEVTYTEWDACVSVGSCPHVPDRWGRGSMPVTNVSWVQAKQYVRWLSKETGQDYRLPSEAEWEYVARAGSATYYSWGVEIGENKANCGVCASRWDNKQTAPVGSFEPNAFGLFDLHGNVWEWVEDVWHDNYTGAPSDGTAWVAGSDPDFRVARGGGWGNGAELLRAHTRVKRIMHVEFDTLGFRVARSLIP